MLTDQTPNTLSVPAVPSYKDTVEYRAYKRFWDDNKNVSVYNALLNGITLNVIAEMHGVSTVDIQQILTNKYFMARLQEYLTGIILANNAAKVMASEDVFNKLWTRVKDNVNDIPVEICLKELTKLLPTKPGSIHISNPKNVKINTKSSKEELDEDFGFEGLPEEQQSNG
jgi:hypothetical protein